MTGSSAHREVLRAGAENSVGPITALSPHHMGDELLGSGRGLPGPVPEQA
ncbi:hypothetical protein ABZY42_17230 [Streptomyces sp. NPDC006622]